MWDDRKVARDEPGTPDRREARLRICLLGEFAVRLDGNPVVELSTPRLQRLLGRLALAPGSGLRRDRLAWELWPESTEAQARTNLRKLLHDLRRLLNDPDDFLEVGSQTLRWRAGCALWIDTVAFAEALSRGDRATAVRHYGGPFLPACYDDWVLAERERLRSLAVEAFTRLAVLADDDRRDGEVVDHARRLLRIDPLHEPAYRLLMQALARRGERNEALRTYHRCVETLHHELDVGPEATTVQVYERLRTPACTGESAASAMARSPLIGRDHEWRIAHAAWRIAAGGQARFLLVTGEAGVGKTRLVEELAGRVAAEGHAVSRTRAYRAAGGLPWGPAVDWLRSEPLRPAVQDLDDVWVGELSRLLPELRTQHPGASEAPPVTDGTRRPHLLDAVRHALLATGRPLLLVVDDLQWCDRETLDLCAFVLQSSPGAPVLVAGTARAEDLDEDHPLTAMERHLARDGQVTAIALGRLDVGATADLATLVGGRALDPEVAGRLWRETEGNPLFVVEAVRAGLGAEEASGRQVLTPTVHAVISARLARLTPDARRLVEIAATIGREFTPEVLASAAGTTEDDLADALDELWRRHIVEERGSTYDFSHDKLRDVALEAISPARLRRLHRLVADALEQHHAHDLGPVSARLGAHYEAAGLDARAVEAYERAARHAYGVFALDDAIVLLRRGLRVLDRSPAGPGRDEVELRLRSARGVALVARRGYGASAVQRDYERVLTLHRRSGHQPDPSVLRGLALHAVTTCRFDRATELAHELAAAGRSDHTARVEAEYVLGVTCFWKGRFGGAEDHLRRAVEEYRPEESSIHIGRYVQDPKGVCLSRLALTQLFGGRPTQADETMDEALGFVHELDHPMTTGYVRAFDAVLAALTPEDHDLGASVAALQVVSSQMRIGYFETLARMLGGWHEVLNGDLGGLDAMRDVTTLLRREQQLHMTLGLGLLARGYLQAGEAAMGRAAVAEAMDWTRRTGQAYLLAELLRIDAELLALGGDRPAAATACSQAVAVATEQGSPWLVERARTTWGVVDDRPLGGSADR